MDEIMSLIGYIMEYTLQEYFGGNKKLFSEFLGLTRPEIYRILQRLHAGGTSAKAAEQLLLAYKRENLSVDDVIASYDGGCYQEKPIVEATKWCVNDVFVQQVFLDYQSLRITKTAYDRRFRIAAHANEFMKHLELMYCKDVKKEGGSCLYCTKDDLKCPCNMFAEFLRNLERFHDEI